MKSRRKKAGLFRRILNRYKKIPRQLRSPKVSQRSSAQKLITLTICVPVLIYCGAYMGFYKLNQSRIERENEQYRTLYTTPEPTQLPIATDSPSSSPQTQAPATAIAAVPETTAFATVVPTQVLTQVPTAAPTILPTIAPTTVPTAIPTADIWDITPAATAMPTFEVISDATLSPYATPDANTLVMALETASPIQESFSGLLALNPETIGYLTVGQDISLPVVQRKNDNDFYLDHNFEGEESNAGTLFLDGANLLAPEDNCLIVYGHNMKNGTMFHSLSKYEERAYLGENALVYFDTIYKNRAYVPFAVFTASMDEDSRYYVDIRRFDLDDYSFEPFVERMKQLSIWDIPVDVRYGDQLLLLVTCEYTRDNGRFVVALRSLREGETEKQLRSAVMGALPK